MVPLDPLLVQQFELSLTLVELLMVTLLNENARIAMGVHKH